MRVPVSWLQEFVDLKATPQEIADRLTFSGMEVEGIETVGASVPGVVAAEILSVEPHPKADRLRICMVHDGQATLRVVCGAPNAAAGMKVLLARIGTTLPSGMVIKQAAIRSVVSDGMLCAADELGLSDDHSGIMSLPAATVPGTPLADIVGAPETVLKLEITWNRPDCLSVLGVARELAALYRLPLRMPDFRLPESGRPIGDRAAVRLEAPGDCPRYTARYLSGVMLAPGPQWMQRRLTLCGVRPINNVVDITNYVMLECGQPLHAFDYDLLADHTIVVRRAAAGETMATLDGAQRALTPEMLVIADARRPVALAGIMGGAGSEINDGTSKVLLESAYFAPPGIHRTSSRAGLATESSYRFERGIDVGAVEWASRRAAALMAEHAQATAAPGVLDLYPGHKPEPRLTCRFARMRSLLGIGISADEVVSILTRLQIPVVERSEEACVVAAPTFRQDLEIEADLIEEVARVHGLENVPSPAPQARINPDVDDVRTRALAACRGALVGLGLAEVMHYSFLSEASLDRFGTGRRAQRAVLPNPVSADYAVMRDSLVPQMMETLGRNLAHQTATAALFELGRVFCTDEAGEVAEDERLCIGLMGKAGRSGMDSRRPVEPLEMFLWAKGVVEGLADALHCGPVSVRRTEDPRLAEGWGVAVDVDGIEAGVMGLVRDSIRNAWRMAEPVAVAELRLEPLLQKVFAAPVARKLSPYPSVERDIAMLVASNVTHAEILATIGKAAPPELTRIELFDIFTGKGVGDGKKSVAYSLVYRSTERSLTDEEANKLHGAVKEELRKRINAEIRES
jgi:phenylalanyl-tRNA synthetase beta chain